MFYDLTQIFKQFLNSLSGEQWTYTFVGFIIFIILICLICNIIRR